jgi:hypothetical protein
VKKRKAKQRELVCDRLEDALKNVYHNATPRHPWNDQDVPGAPDYWDWFCDQASMEIDYINDRLGEWDGRQYKGQSDFDYRKAKRLSYFPRRMAYGVVSELERQYAPLLDGTLQRYGKVYSWGRGGRTVAPKDWIRTRGGGSFNVCTAKDFNHISYEDKIDLIRTIEAFNDYVEKWNKNVPELWRTYIEDCVIATREDHLPNFVD